MERKIILTIIMGLMMGFIYTSIILYIEEPLIQIISIIIVGGFDKLISHLINS